MLKRSKKSKLYFMIGIAFTILITVLTPFFGIIIGMISAEGDPYNLMMSGLFYGVIVAPFICIIGISITTHFTKKEERIGRRFIIVYMVSVPILLILIFMIISADPRSGLIRAVAEGDTKAISKLLNRRSLQINQKVNFKGSETYALLEAVRTGNIEIVELLLKNGADPNLQAFEPAIVTASKNGNCQIVEMLIRYGADIESKIYYDSNALIVAAAEGHDRIVDKLLKAGANINAKSREGTAIQEACYNKKYNTVKILLEYNPTLEGVSSECIERARESGPGDQGDAVNYGTKRDIRKIYSFSKRIRQKTQIKALNLKD